MAFNDIERERIENLLVAYIEKLRPPAHMRDQLDLGYRIAGQSVEIFEIRPDLKNKTQKLEIACAKATYVRAQDNWKVFWMRQDMKWHGYEPAHQVKAIEGFLNVVATDEYGCFFG